MRARLRGWIADADTRHSIRSFVLATELPALAYQDGRLLDLYSSLVGELFDLLRASEVPDGRDWASLGNGLGLVAEQMEGRTQADAYFYSASAYYLGGLSASAYLMMNRAEPQLWGLDSFLACYDLLGRRQQIRSGQVADLLGALAAGDSDGIRAVRADAEHAAAAALQVGPDEWVSSRVLVALLDRFQQSHVRAVLPEGDSERWTPLVTSFLERRPAVWDFFPSQIEAIEAGLLGTGRTYSMQMPTGAGKTALTETLIYDHLIDRPNEVAALLVPFRSLARELRTTMGMRLTRMGFATRTVYGGTVPTPEETQDLDSIRVVIATPEAMMGLLGNVPNFAERISLLVCDEGHLLDAEGRGVGLELLLARFRGARTPAPPRMVFVSAVVPNIEEINAWLGGSDDTVVRSEFRPAGAEYSVLRPNAGTGRQLRLALELRAQAGTNLPTHSVQSFLSVNDFEYINASTNRTRTYKFDSYKTQAIATARKALPLGTVAVFTRSKRGPQGVISLAEELADQLTVGLPMPTPEQFMNGHDILADIGAYLVTEYGEEWVGTTALAAGVVVHHGDIPQETRDAFEEILVAGNVRMVLCTSTLAEGVNLPIRTLVVYTTQITTAEGTAPMLSREIRNLVGRAGRPGSATKGLVVCVNENQWDVIDRVAEGALGEPVEGALLKDIETLVRTLSSNNLTLNNGILEALGWLYPLVDGIDSTLVELLRDDMGDEEFRTVAASLASGTFAWRRTEDSARAALRNVFTLRAERLSGLRATGRISWAAGTGVKARLLDSVADSLVPAFERWETVEDPTDAELLEALLSWAWGHPDFASALRVTYPEKELIPPTRLPDRADLLQQLRLWLEGNTFAQMSTTTRDVNRLLRIHTGVLSYAFNTLVEQAVVVLVQIFAGSDLGLSPTVTMLPDYIRYGVRSLPARNLMADGVRHRRAANLLGENPAMNAQQNALLPATEVARTLMRDDPAGWRSTLGDFVYKRTVRDLGITVPPEE